MKGYSKYKNSGIEWLGKIPGHWETRRLKFLAKVCNGQDQKKVVDDNGVYPIFGSGGIFGKSNKFLYNKTSVLLGRKGTIDKPLFAEKPFWTVDTMFFTKIKDNVFPKFFYYLCKTIPFDLYSDQTTLPSMTQTELNNIPLLFIIFKEQRKIAEFLDKRTEQIDNLIKKKKELIEKLKEQKISLITNAVTGKLNLTTEKIKYKNSGIEWLGKIPKHWKVLQLRNLIYWIKTGGTPKGANEEYFEENGYNWYTPCDFTEDIYLNKASRSLSDLGKNQVKIFPANTVMMIGIGATIGKVAVAQKTSSCNQQINGIVCSEKLNPLFAAYHLKIMKQFIVNCGKFTTLPIINQDETKNLLIAYPPISEQREIAKYLDKKTDQIDNLSNKVEEAIKKLEEYRTALITEAVTGKIKI